MGVKTNLEKEKLFHEKVVVVFYALAQAVGFMSCISLVVILKVVSFPSRFSRKLANQLAPLLSSDIQSGLHGISVLVKSLAFDEMA
jgi:hypothetical protein